MGSETSNLPKIYPSNPKTHFLLHFHDIISKSQRDQLTMLTPCSRGRPLNVFQIKLVKHFAFTSTEVLCSNSYFIQVVPEIRKVPLSRFGNWNTTCLSCQLSFKKYFSFRYIFENTRVLTYWDLSKNSEILPSAYPLRIIAASGFMFILSLFIRVKEVRCRPKYVF